MRIQCSQQLSSHHLFLLLLRLWLFFGGARGRRLDLACGAGGLLLPPLRFPPTLADRTFAGITSHWNMHRSLPPVVTMVFPFAKNRAFVTCDE